jgi:transposase-like protein
MFRASDLPVQQRTQIIKALRGHLAEFGIAQGGWPAKKRRIRREIMPCIEHRQHRSLNNRAENSHQPTRRCECIMKHFKSAG